MIPLTLLLVLTGAILVILIFLTELERFGWVTVTLLLSAVAVQWLQVADILDYIAGHGLQILYYTVGYLVLGLIWSFFKWFSFLLVFRVKFQEYKKDWYSLRNLPLDQPLNQELSNEFTRSCFREYHGNKLNTKPLVADNKHRIVAWMSFWPFSLVGTLLNDPVKMLFSFLFDRLQGTYQSMSDRMFKADDELK